MNGKVYFASLTLFWCKDTFKKKERGGDTGNIIPFIEKIFDNNEDFLTKSAQIVDIWEDIKSIF